MPRAAETFLKIFTNPGTVYINVETGKVCQKSTDQTIPFSFSSLTQKDAMIIDTGTQLGLSIFSLCMLLHPSYRHAKKWWGDFYEKMNIIMTRIKSSSHTKIICIAHEQIEEPPEDNTTRRKTRGGSPIEVGMHYPIWGSKNYSLNVCQFFGSILNLYTSEDNYRVNSTPTSARKVIAGNRYDINIDSLKAPEIADLLTIKPTKQ